MVLRQQICADQSELFSNPKMIRAKRLVDMVMKFLFLTFLLRKEKQVLAPKVARMLYKA
jgi:hypothetical protein